MLMYASGKPDVRQRLAEFVQGGNDVVFVFFEIVGIAAHTVRPDRDNLTAIFLQELSPLDRLRNVVVSRRRIEQVRPTVSRDQRKVVLFDQRRNAAACFHSLDLEAE